MHGQQNIKLLSILCRSDAAVKCLTFLFPFNSIHFTKCTFNSAEYNLNIFIRNYASLCSENTWFIVSLATGSPHKAAFAQSVEMTHGTEPNRLLMFPSTVLPPHYSLLVLPIEAINPLNAELNPICYLLALLGPHHFLHVSRIRVKSLTLRLLMSHIYGAPILDVSRSHTTTHHSR